MKAYLDILKDIKENGHLTGNRTETAAFRITGAMFKHNMSEGFPLLTTKKVNLKTVSAELEFFIKGLTDKTWLQERNCHIWDEWCNPRKVAYGHDEETKKKMAEENDLGVIYGYQWRNFGGWEDEYLPNDSSIIISRQQGVDQLHNVIETLKTNPTDRRMIVMAWNPMHLNQMALPPCHFGFQVTSDGEYVDLTWFQRSVDTFLGLPFNIASYGLLLELIAKTVGMKARYLVGQLVDVHIYENHIEQVDLQLSREPYTLPTLKLPDDVNIFEWEYDQYELIGYDHHPFIKAPIAI